MLATLTACRLSVQSGRARIPGGAQVARRYNPGTARTVTSRACRRNIQTSRLLMDANAPLRLGHSIGRAYSLNANADHMRSPSVAAEPDQSVKERTANSTGHGVIKKPGRFRHLKAIHDSFRTLWAAHKGTWLALDFEMWERDHSILTEIGWSVVRWEEGTEVEETGHWIIKEHMKYVNKMYVKGNRDAKRYGATIQHYNFGKSKIMSLGYAKTQFRKLVDRHRKNGPLYFVLHDSAQDLVQFNELFHLPSTLKNIIAASSSPKHDTSLYLVDTTDLYAAILQSESQTPQKRALKKICAVYGIEVQYPHNAGNDAHYTMLAAKAMTSVKLPPVDHTGTPIPTVPLV